MVTYIKCGGEEFTIELKPIGKVCQLCKKETPLVTLTTQKLKLCKSCFSSIQERRVLEAVKKYKMFGPSDRVGIFLSGGKDSAVLAYLLRKVFPEIFFQGIYLNLGIRYYSDYAQKAVEALCAKIDLPLYVYSLPEKESFRIDDFVFTSFKDKICSVCGTIKRYLFSKLAREHELNVIATGHHLDDLISTYLTLFLSGDFESIRRLKPVNPPLYPGQAKKVKPLFQIPEKEIFMLAHLMELPLEGCSCPHGELTPAKKTKKWLSSLEEENRTIKYQLLSIFLHKFIPLLKEEKTVETFLPCTKCGEPTTSPNGICGRCRRVDLLNRVPERRLELSLEEWEKIQASPEREEWILFSLREREDQTLDILGPAKEASPDLLLEEKKFFKTFKPFRKRKLLFYCYSGRLGYLFTLKLRKHSFQAYNLRVAENYS